MFDLALDIIMAPKIPIRRKIEKACKAMKTYGVPAKTVKSTLKQLLEAYDNNWVFIEDEKYKVLLEAIFPENPKTTSTVNDDLKLLRYESEEEEEEDEVPLLKRPRLRRQIISLTPADITVPCSINYASETQQLVETHTETVIIKEEHQYEEIVPMPPFENTVTQHAPATHLSENDCKSNNLLSLEYNNIDNNENENENVDVSSCSSEIDVASSSNGEVNLTFVIRKPSQGFCIPNMNEVMNQVENMYREKFQLIGSEISISGILKDLCQCFVEQGNGNSQSILPIVDNLKEPEKSNSAALSRSHYPKADREQPVNIVTQPMNRSSKPNNWIVYQRKKIKMKGCRRGI
ncbi:probable inactive histone-lysine N-methyltransferase SUVR2 [Rutidosis leptorrhynchoides]|uniref:probable inactive histone-lysine N-methyltransferase SUVR2 n=1 Tax=Rutidosis leptorrhynchoides TaxID=125765 RepID=UPI003A992C00